MQFARVLGARVIATTSTAEKAERLKAVGASEVINYTETADWDEKARELTEGRGRPAPYRPALPAFAAFPFWLANLL